MAKSTSGLPGPQRVALIGASAAAGSAGVKIGASVGKSMVENIVVEEMVKKSEHANTDPDSIPSPGSGPNISSILEQGDQSIPLVDLLEGIFSYNILELILIFLLIYVISYKKINDFIINFISNIIKKYIPGKYENWNEKLEKSKDYNNKFIKLSTIVLFFLLITFKICNLFVSGVLYVYIDDYVIVYNYLKNISQNSTLFLLSACPEN